MNRIVLVVVLLKLAVSNLIAREIYVGGTGASDANAGTATAPFATIQKAASVAVAGDVIKIRGGTYRETISPTNSGTPGNPIIYEPDNGATVIISGLNQIDNAGWTVHSGNIYRKSITLPVNNYNVTITSNVVLAANQIFKDGNMVIEARWPKADNVEELFDRNNLRQRNSTSSWNGGTIVDNGIPNIPGGWAGGKIWITGWYASQSATINSQSGNTLTFNPVAGSNNFLQYYYLTGKLGALTQANEFHYENNTLYVWQPGGGSPTGIEYKARNWGFDLRNRSYIEIKGVRLVGCDVNGNASTSNITIDNIRATYLNHTFLQEGVGDLANVLYNNPKQTGFRLLGPNNVVVNSEFKYAASNGLFVGKSNRVENNKFEWINYEGNYGAAVLLFDAADNVKILKNTFSHIGRSAIDFGYVYDDRHYNVDIGYNDIMYYGMLSADGGGVYAARWQYLNGTRVHHNWIHNSLAEHTPSPGFANGINAGLYYDHATGSNTINDHNVFWDNKQCDLHISTCWHGEGRNDSRGKAVFYNNTCATRVYDNYVHGYFSYLNISQEYYDVHKNNIYRARNINVQGSNWADATNGLSPFDVANCLNRSTDPLFAGGSVFNPTVIARPQDYFQIQAASPARNTGATIAGITDGSVGVPDIGAYEYGGEKWVAGYVAVAVATPTNVRPTVALTAPANNATVQQGTAVQINATAADSDGSVQRVEFYDGATKIGEDLTSPYSFSWTNAAVGTHTITARATDNANATTTSASITITITANNAPVVTVTSPADNAVIPFGDPITLAATASDVGGTIVKVEFFDNTAKLGEDLTAPFTFVWTNAAAGSHRITARATDNDNNSVTSTEVTITVNSNAAPVVALTAPANNSSFTSGQALTVTATASDSDGTVAKVEFFNGTTKLGEDVTSPYSYTWAAPPVGTHTLTARATDNKNLSATSAGRTVTITATVGKPAVSITSPGGGAQFSQGTAITVNATASVVGGTITKVEFFNGSQKLGEDVSSPYNYVWIDAPVGRHSLTASATDNLGASTVSSPVQVEVTALSLANVNPEISLTSPANDSRALLTDEVVLVASATDADGNITRVEFYVNGEKVGEDVDAPFSYTWQAIEPGTYELTAVAIDNQSATTTSSAVRIVIINEATESPSNNDLYGGIPRFFSPNGDGSGDQWVWASLPEYQNSRLSVSNRAGALVYQSNSYDNSWDGTASGRALEAGDYYYVVTLANSTTLKGAVRIIR